MKKTLLSLFLALTIFSALAQDNISEQIYTKKGQAILPVKGDWVIGVDATPFLDYIGNIALISSDNSNAPEFTFTAQRPGQLFGKYYLKDNKALRIGVRFGISSFTDKDGNPADPGEIDELKESSLNIGVSAGIENYRTIKGRLRGFWGYEASVNKTPYSGLNYFGNNAVTGKVTFEDALISSNNYSEEGGNTINISIKGLIGIEYFFAPKISLSGEFGIGLGYQNTTERKYYPNSGTMVIYDAGSSGISMANTSSGAIVLLFHF